MLVIAAALLVLLGIGHSVLGEVYIIRPLYREVELPRLRGTEFPLSTIRFAWHVTSLLALGIAVILVQIAIGLAADAIVVAIGGTLLACSIVSLIYSRGRHPSWIVFLAAGALCLLAASIPLT